METCALLRLETELYRRLHAVIVTVTAIFILALAIEIFKTYAEAFQRTPYQVSRSGFGAFNRAAPHA